MATSMAREFVEGWTLAHTLGEGAFGEVKLVINRLSGEAVAMKMIDLKKHPDAKTLVRKEICIQKMLQNPHILRFFGQRSQSDVEYIFLEYASGGELFDRIEPDVGMSAFVAQRYFKQLLSGVQYLHSRGVAHRDLKPENLLLDEHDNLKISDFGMATMFRMKGRERLLDKRCGTLPYVAPEVFIKPYNAEPADLWSCGIILVAMLAGELPWDQPSSTCTEYISWRNDVYTALTPWTKLDTSVLCLVRKILFHEPEKRPTLSSILGHRWCKTHFVQERVKSDDVVDSPLKRNSPGEENISSRVCLSQPTKYVTNSLAEDILQSRVEISFSQPTLLDDLVLGSQLNLTQGTQQNAFQKLVKRMTRFFVSGGSANALKRLIASMEKLGYSWKSSEGMLTISTMDRRKMQLVFKCNIIDMDDKVLLDFRLSKGCGLEFKRNFIKIKHSLSDIIEKGAAPWPIN